MNFLALPNLSQNCKHSLSSLKFHSVQDAGALLGSSSQKSGVNFCLWGSADHRDQRYEASAPSRHPVDTHIPRQTCFASPPALVCPFFLDKEFSGKSCV